eukprot:365034-Chlamydomonas_euryale.AAC.9
MPGFLAANPLRTATHARSVRIPACAPPPMPACSNPRLRPATNASCSTWPTRVDSRSPPSLLPAPAGTQASSTGKPGLSPLSVTLTLTFRLPSSPPGPCHANPCHSHLFPLLFPLFCAPQARLRLSRAQRAEQQAERAAQLKAAQREALLEASRRWVGSTEELTERINAALDAPRPFGFITNLPRTTL